MDTGLDENEAELGVLVLAVGLKVLADGDRLFDEVPEILGDLGGKAYPMLVMSRNSFTAGLGVRLYDTYRAT